MRDKPYIKNKLETILKDRKHTQVKLAQELEVSSQAVGNWINDREGISDENLRKLCCYFEITPEKIIYLDFEEFKKTLNIKNDQIQTSNNPGKRRDKGSDG